MTGETIDVDLSGLCLRFEGLSPVLASELRRWCPDYVRASNAPPALVIRVEDDDRSMTPSRFMSGALHIEALPDAVRFKRDEGELVQDVPGVRAVVRLSQGDTGRQFWGLMNLTLAATGWRLISRGGGALHAAGVLVGGRAYLLVGPSGCGKSTWARTAAEAGHPVLSDDCVLVECSDGRLVALGSPFRSSDFPAPGPGRWPVAALLLPRHAEVPALAPVSRLVLEARVAANLLFSTTAWSTHTITASAVGAITAGAPARVLDFRPDASWIELLSTIAEEPDSTR